MTVSYEDADGEYGLRLDMALSYTIERFPAHITAVHIMAFSVCQLFHFACP